MVTVDRSQTMAETMAAFEEPDTHVDLAMAALQWQQEGWAVMVVREDGTVAFHRGIGNREAKQALRLTAQARNLKLWDKSDQRIKPLFTATKSTKLRTTRPAISASLRWTVLERDGRRCTYCGANAPDTVLHIDHIVPVSKGGTTTAENLTTSCRDCNLGKKDRELKA